MWSGKIAGLHQHTTSSDIHQRGQMSKSSCKISITAISQDLLYNNLVRTQNAIFTSAISHSTTISYNYKLLASHEETSLYILQKHESLIISKTHNPLSKNNLEKISHPMPLQFREQRNAQVAMNFYTWSETNKSIITNPCRPPSDANSRHSKLWYHWRKQHDFSCSPLK